MIYINKEPIKTITFPNKEVRIDVKDIMDIINRTWVNITLTLKFENNNDLINLMFIKKYLDSINIEAELEILYMPYSRMDRTENQTVFTLKYISEFINDLNFSKVFVYEPHSDVTNALLNKCTAFYPVGSMLTSVMQDVNFGSDDYIYYPDNGAEKRYSKMIKSPNVLIGSKKRDFETGNIIGLDVIGSVKKEGFKVIMIDDLCSKGTTFLKGAEKLKEMGASEIYLIVTHCEDTIFEGELLKTDLVNAIYTTDSMARRAEHAKIKVTSLI